MRIDEEGNSVPATLGEYRDLCAALGGEHCRAVAFLDQRIEKSPNGREEGVIAADSQMRYLLMPTLIPRVEDK